VTVGLCGGPSNDKTFTVNGKIMLVLVLCCIMLQRVMLESLLGVLPLD